MGLLKQIIPILIWITFLVMIVADEDAPMTAAEKDKEKWRCSKFIYNATGIVNHTIVRMRYADHIIYQTIERPFDLWFDRLAYIVHEGRYDRINDKKSKEMIADLSVTLPAILLNKRNLLTSLNPFRDIIRFRFKKHFTTICIMNSRRYSSKQANKLMYLRDGYKINCARPVIPKRDEEIEQDLWHGYDYNEKMHTPLHDLLVLRTDKDIKYILEKSPHDISFYENSGDATEYHRAGPIITKLASEHDILGRSMKFGMVGHNRDTFMHVREYEPDENAVTDCDEWIPREWGWFICLRNLDNIERFGSGAMLYSDDKLFGVGSFSLFKGTKGVLVFTDVRKYIYQIYNTCTEEDMELKPSKIPPDTNYANYTLYTDLSS